MSETNSMVGEREPVHLVDDQHWSGWCHATTGSGSEDANDVTCQECLRLAGDPLSSAEPDAGDMEALREVLAGSESGNWQAYAALTALAEDILNSDWLDAVRRKAGDERAERIEAKWEARANALIDALCDCGDFDGHPGDCAATIAILVLSSSGKGSSR